MTRGLSAGPEELVELATSTVESILLRFGDSRPDEWSAIVVDDLEHDLFDRLNLRCGIVATAPDDLAAKHPEVIAVTQERLARRAPGEKIEQERREEFDEMPAESQIAVVVAPTVRPVIEILAQVGQGIARIFPGDNRCRPLALFRCRHAPDPVAQRVSPLPRLRLPARLPGPANQYHRGRGTTAARVEGTVFGLWPASAWV